MSASEPSQLQRRAEERAALKESNAGGWSASNYEASSGPRILSRFEAIWTLCILVVTAGSAILAAASNRTVLQAVTDPGWYFWLGLCAISAVALGLTVVARRRGVSVPVYFRLVLMIGVTLGVVTCPKA